MVLSFILALALHEIGDLVDHATHCRRIFEFRDAIQATQTKAANRRTMRLFGANQALNELDLDFFLSHGLPQDFFNRLAALGRNFGRRAHRLQPVDGGANDVVRIG